LVAAGVVFCLLYVNRAVCDVVYTDYIRIVNTYLPDVFDLSGMAVPDILTRVPANYIARMVNVGVFGYSTLFDVALGAVGVGMGAWALALYCRRRGLGVGWFALLMPVVFGLGKWEMMNNGTGWAHFWAMGLIYLYFEMMDGAVGSLLGPGPEPAMHGADMQGRGRHMPGGAGLHAARTGSVWLCLLAPVITLLFAGPYCVAISVVALVGWGWVYLCGKPHRDRGCVPTHERFGPHIADGNRAMGSKVSDYDLAGSPKSGFVPSKGRVVCTALCVAVPFALYIWSNAYAVEDHAGAADVAFGAAVRGDLLFPFRFLLKALSTVLLGSEQLIGEFGMSGTGMCTLGLAVFLGYVACLWINVRQKPMQETWFPTMLLLMGLASHGLVFASRWIFLSDTYGMSSRYALQYQAGALGMVLTVASLRPGRAKWGAANPREEKPGEAKPNRRGLWPVAGIYAITICVFILAGSLYTTASEWRKAPYRKAYGEHIREVAMVFDTVDDETLRRTFDYRTQEADSGAKVRSALTILKKHGWNVFREDALGHESLIIR
jgi:hypothetical protein